MIRDVLPEDISKVQLLDRLCNLPAWPAGDYQGLLKRQDIHFIGFVPVSSENRQLIGFCLTLVAEDAEILKIAVDPEWQGRGLGCRLLQDAVENARRRGCRSCFLEVRPSNRGAIDFYLGNKFEILSCRKGYYSQPPEDALVMRIKLQ
ncbi:MAG: ribosomal protein S18-alanine N-acetyltransferase [Acidobacteriota bacterium]